MEYIDVLDKDGNKTGLTKPKPEIHKNGDWHRDSRIWIINSQNELLIQRRSSAKESYPNLWDISAAGHISAGENSITSALREIEEELGLRLDKEEMQYLFSVTQQVVLNNGIHIDNEIQDVYLVNKDIDVSGIRIQKEEVTEVKFVHFKQLEKMIINDPSSFAPHPKEYKQLFEFLEKNAK